MVEIWRSFILLLPVLLTLLFLKHWWSGRHFPPGPLCLPILGNMWALGSSMHEDVFEKLNKKYGNIYTLCLGNQWAVVLCGFKTVKEGLVGYAEEFSDRIETAFFTSRGKARGMAFSSGPLWKQQRQVANFSLRQLGVENKKMERQIKDGAQQLVDIFARTKGQPFDPALLFLKSAANIICALNFGYQLDFEDKNLEKLIQSTNNIEKMSGSVFHMMFEIAPWLIKRLPGPHQKVLDSAEFIFSLGMQEIEKHKQNQSLHEPQDFIDFYLLQMQKSKADPNSVYTEENLACCLSELFVAGTDSVYSTLTWAVLLLTNHPDIQEKVHKEIEDVFGASGSISYQDRYQLPYTNAVIHETQRLKYIILITIPRRSRRDVNMAGFHIPKGTAIVPDLRSVLHDPEQWETPEEFNPNHFLDKEGNFQTREEFMTFGAGHRVCFGERLARVEIFLNLTNLLRTFSFQLPQEVTKLNDKPRVHMALYPQPYKICAIPHHTML